MKNIYFIIFFLIMSFGNAQTNIFDACRNGSVNDVVSIYTKNPNSINATNESGYTPLILACYYSKSEVVKFLIDKVDDINGTSDYGTPIMAAVVKGNIEIIQMLLSRNADTNIADANGTTALHYATLFKQTEIVKLLVKAGAKVDIKDGQGRSPMDYATLNNNEEILKIFKNI